MSPPDLPPAGPTRPAGTDPAERLLRRLEWTVLRRLDGLRQGDARTLLRGAGLDLADLREYQPGDDVRHIDWNVTARLQQTHVREFHAERDMSVVFLLDLSASADWGSVLNELQPGSGPGSAPPPAAATALRSKQQVATELVAVLARLFTRAGHRVGAVIYRQRVDQVLSARGGRTQVLRLLHALARPATTAATAPYVPSATPDTPGPASAATTDRPHGWRRLLPWRRARSAAPQAGETTRLADLLLHAERSLRRRCSLLLVSDFLSQPGWEAPLGRLALRHDVIAVHLGDPAERELPAAGLVVLQDAESGDTLLVDSDDPDLRARHAELAARQAAQLDTALARAGVDRFELGTAEPLLDTLQRFLALRRLRAQARAATSPPGGPAPAVPPAPPSPPPPDPTRHHHRPPP